MTRTTDTMQREAATPTAALVGPAMRDPQLGNGWASGIANREWGTSRTHGFTAKRSTRHLRRSST
jgi:hypothetical protein